MKNAFKAYHILDSVCSSQSWLTRKRTGYGHVVFILQILKFNTQIYLKLRFPKNY